VIVPDSGFLVGLYNERDAHHGAARSLMERFLNGEWGRRLLLDARELDFVPCSDLFSGTFETFIR
jgi:predicted nucleic acid-binding protein